jgi:hypothetical protein
VVFHRAEHKGTRRIPVLAGQLHLICFVPLICSTALFSFFFFIYIHKPKKSSILSAELAAFAGAGMAGI